MIKGVTVRKLRLIPDERGYLMEMLRSDWEEYDKFGQVYITAVYPGVGEGAGTITRSRPTTSFASTVWPRWCSTTDAKARPPTAR